MEKFTVEEFESLIEYGESLKIIDEHGDSMIIPYGEYEEDGDLIRIHTDHEEGC